MATELQTVREHIKQQATEAFGVVKNLYDAGELAMRVVGRTKLMGVDETTIWPNEVRAALGGIQDMIVLADRGNIKPSALRRLPLYQVAMTNLRDLVEENFMITIGEGAGFNFTLERGVEELLREECKKINDQGTCKCKIRFVKATGLPETDIVFYDRITIRFDGQFDLHFIDRARYGS